MGVAAGRVGDFVDAQRATAWAEERFAARGDPEGRAGAARCAWRSANYFAAEGYPGQALEAGRRAVGGFTALVEESFHPVWNRELVRAGADASVFAVMAGHYDEAVALASRAVESAQAARAKGLDMGRDLQTELGTALHNLAAAHSSRAVAGDGDLRAALRAADEEIRLRRTLIGSAPDLATWELASGLAQRGRIRAVAGERDSARYDLREALGLAARLGVAGQGIAREATAALDELGPG